ncbi:MAG: F420-0--gamma-glutamyl ligase [Clostridia bacterium]|nr:F420-0--gamma-glutamyl ligase [Clostridia bacterium]
MVNPNKNYEINTSFGFFGREVIKTHFIGVGEDIFELAEAYMCPHCNNADMIAISSKIVSLCQKRVVYKKDMKLCQLAKFLSKFATSNDTGVGVNCVWKMQYAIDYCGRLKVLLAAVCSGLGKLVGKKGIFYDIVGIEIRGLDGFYDKSFRQYGEYGIQIPVNCDELCEKLSERIGVPVFIADANDFTRDIFGKSGSVTYTDAQLCEILRDNPAGQSDQCTPFIIIRKVER